jgi:transposase
LAQLLRADLLPEAWIAPHPVRQLRALLRHRTGLVRLRTQQQNRIHAVVADFGYDRSGSYLTGPGRGWLAGLELPAVSRELVTDALTVIDGLAPVIERIDGELRTHAKADPRVKILTTLPGAVQFTALVMLAEIGDITRFPTARKLASWAGLTPAVRGSDLHVRHGHISKQGSAWLRWVLNQAAQTAKRSPGILRHLHRHRQAPQEEDRHHRDLPQAADPRLAPARRGPGTGPGRTGRQHGRRSTTPDREGHQAPGELALAA